MNETSVKIIIHSLHLLLLNIINYSMPHLHLIDLLRLALPKEDYLLDLNLPVDLNYYQ